MGWRLLKVTRFVFVLLTFSIVQSFSEPVPYQDWSFNDFKSKESVDNSWPFNNENIHWPTPEDDDNQKKTEMATRIIAGVIIFLVIASFIAFLICLCCPICILAKMRNRRRGVVYHPAGTGNGATTTTIQSGNSRTTVTVLRQGAPSTPASSIVVAPNSAPANSPYPVQQSVNVMPVPMSNGQANYGQHQYPNMPYPNQPAVPYPTGPNGMPVPMVNASAPPPGELPPPYPGLPREMDSVVGNSAQPAYNPYYGGNGGGDAPSPYMPTTYMSTTAPYPTKH